MYPRFGELTFVTPYGLMLVIGLLICWFCARRRAPGFDIDASHVDLIVPLVFAASVLGSQILAIVLTDSTLFTTGSFASRAHLNLFGLLLLAVPVLYVYCRLSGLSAGKMLDLFAPPVLACLMVTRLGCFMAGCCWGDLARPSPQLEVIHESPVAGQVLTLPWLANEHILGAVSFPAGSFAWRQHLELGLIEPGASASLAVHPTQLYEFFLLAVLLVLLRRVEYRGTATGTTFFFALGSYALLRFFIEFLRADSPLWLARLTIIQLICGALVLGCVAGLTVARRPMTRDF